MPRPIPDDVENVTGFIWYLIPVPDDPVFVQAAWDAFSELTYPWNWGKEGRVPESDIAAQLWSDAIYEALRVRDMGFPDNILDAVDEVEGLLRDILLASCCANTSVTGDTVTSDIEPDVGDPPSTWGDAEPVSSWQEWRELVCGATDTWITHLIGQVGTIETYLDLGLFTIGVAVAVLSAGAGAGILISIAYGTAVEMFSAILANVNDLVFLDIEDGLQNQRAEIRCAVFLGCDELKAEIQTAVGTIAWNAWYQFYDWCSIRNSLLEGTFEGGFHAVNPLSACDTCPDFTFDFLHDANQDDLATNSDGWVASGTGTARDNSGIASCGTLWTLRASGVAYWHILPQEAASQESYALPPAPYEAYVEQVVIDECRSGGATPEYRIELYAADGSLLETSPTYTTSGEKTWVPSTKGPVRNVSGSSPFGVRIASLNGTSAIALSRIRVWYTIVDT